MKQFYDKILLLLAIAALVATVVLFPAEEPDSPADLGDDAMPSADPVEVGEVIPYREVSVSWSDMPPQNNNPAEQFDIFTSPKIYWDPVDNELDFEPPEDIVPPTPFGLRLVSIDRELYRIQVEAIIGSGDRALIQLYDSDTGESLRGRIGETFDEQQIEIRDYTDEVRTEGDMRIRERIVTIYDQRLDQELELQPAEQVFTDDYTIRFETVVTRHPNGYRRSQQFVVHEVGDRFTVRVGENQDIFELMSFDYEEQKATVKKFENSSTKEEDIKVKELEVKKMPETSRQPDQSPTASSPSAPENQTSTPANNTSLFDDFFN